MTIIRGDSVIMAFDDVSDGHECLFACYHHKDFYIRYVAK
jgi:hypothetical protein